MIAGIINLCTVCVLQLALSLCGCLKIKYSINIIMMCLISYYLLSARISGMARVWQSVALATPTFL